MSDPIICFGQQPCGIFPKRFLFAKIKTARRLQQQIGGEIVFFYHDSDHDPRETVTVLTDRSTGEKVSLNFEFENKIQKIYSPLYLKRMVPGWKTKWNGSCRLMWVRFGGEVQSGESKPTVAELCLAMYESEGLRGGLRLCARAIQTFAPSLVRSMIICRSPCTRARLCGPVRVTGNFGCIRAGTSSSRLRARDFGNEQVSPTRDTRFRWMQSVIGCTHYVSGASEQHYINKADAPGVLLSSVKKSRTQGRRIPERNEDDRLRIGIACFPLIGGSGILGDCARCRPGAPRARGSFL